jgi:hypothetical protein
MLRINISYTVYKLKPLHLTTSFWRSHAMFGMFNVINLKYLCSQWNLNNNNNIQLVLNNMQNIINMIKYIKQLMLTYNKTICCFLEIHNHDLCTCFLLVFMENVA